ncbi:MBOAT family O-acyltransferase [Paucibacter sp. Y2R2-4]|uniref:MBOAT family O-acyltransferase n=1 Tax=Paucibacter sp. Y2R2-4 TaxID=2893553 RepID=UPI0021E3B5BB|nr:MBOAT family O-acyltransferase [Paucibacter sp. Y2R2-4]MCV2349764.1 hypothetical protein [Paucibacter sp. Y2R2-4]
MLSSPINEFAGPTYWLFSAAAIICLSFAASPGKFHALWAGLNLSFLIFLIGFPASAVLGIVLLVLHINGKLIHEQLRWSVAVISSSLLFVAFLAHKMQHPPKLLEDAKFILAAIGFSYIFLRCLEYIRGSTNKQTQSLTIFNTINYLIPFHMLAAGPVMGLADFKKNLSSSPTLDQDGVIDAFERIASGLFKKFVLANGIIESLFLTGFKSDGIYLFIEIQLYYLFIYLDFSAYSDIAIGLGRLLGVKTPENFNKPLSSRNIIEFWERWHISLSQLIRRNIFIPIQLAGMRWTDGQYPRLVSSAAFLSAFLLCGLWHGVTWRFFLWGAGHATALVICNYYRDWLVGRLGKRGASNFSNRPLVRRMAQIMTFQFVALSLTFLAYPGFDFLG